uniref:Leucine rich immune protein (Coil-less) n=1 Tax=Anopheles funestus TaxID=62324 RepID=A0A4Y0BN48_ANOFN
MSLGRVLVFLLLLAYSSGNYTSTLWEHRCDPGSEIFACTVPNFLYKPNQNHSKLIAPEPVHKVRLAYPSDKVISRQDVIIAYDATLHDALHRPKAVQIANAAIKRFEVPFDLEYADFRDNSISTVIAPQVNGSEYALRYLDLQNNELDRIDNLRNLVNLETLLLSNNHISVLDGSTLNCFTKLISLHLTNNELVEIPVTNIPASLEWLILRNNMLFGPMKFIGAHLPALKVLDLYDNYCDELDVDVLLLAAPNLEAIRLERNFISAKEAKVIMECLALAGVTHDKFVKSDERDHYYRTQQKIKMHEDIISAMIAVVNVCVIGWGAFRVYKSRSSTETVRSDCSNA